MESSIQISSYLSLSHPVHHCFAPLSPSLTLHISVHPPSLFSLFLSLLPSIYLFPLYFPLLPISLSLFLFPFLSFSLFVTPFLFPPSFPFPLLSFTLSPPLSIYLFPLYCLYSPPLSLFSLPHSPLYYLFQLSYLSSLFPPILPLIRLYISNLYFPLFPISLSYIFYLFPLIPISLFLPSPSHCYTNKFYG